MKYLDHILKTHIEYNNINSLDTREMAKKSGAILAIFSKSMLGAPTPLVLKAVSWHFSC